MSVKIKNPEKSGQVQRRRLKIRKAGFARLRRIGGRTRAKRSVKPIPSTGTSSKAQSETRF